MEEACIWMDTGRTGVWLAAMTGTGQYITILFLLDSLLGMNICEGARHGLWMRF
jgi:hypothetical protein